MYIPALPVTLVSVTVRSQPTVSVLPTPVKFTIITATFPSPILIDPLTNSTIAAVVGRRMYVYSSCYHKLVCTLPHYVHVY